MTLNVSCKYCDVAQLVEHLTLTQKVVGSKPAITTMESKPGRVWEPSGKRVGPQGLCFEYTALRILRDGRVAYCATP